ncbi:UDP-N-acetylglucosamine 2-epimerase (non-hydrolyzing) [Quisquiliibacterium transsilvanicum]
MTMNQDSRKHLLVVIGTRPEAIKLAPLVLAIERSGWARCELVLTGQHRDLVQPIVDHFGLKVAHDLHAMLPGQALAAVTARILQGFDALLERARPDAVFGQGDTVSVLATSLACFFRQVPFAHVEAGLRTGNPLLPFPEEMNRVLTSRMTRWHFAPTGAARDNLLAEGIAAADIEVTGNTVIDALQAVLAEPEPAGLPVTPGRDFVLVTAHRRENHGAAMARICDAIATLAARHPELDFVFPVHPNPAVRQTTDLLLRGLANVRLVEPCAYPEFCWLMKRARVILSDSGGVQEEAPALARPVLVLRDETERPEAVALGANLLVGTDTQRIVDATEALLSDTALYARMAGAGSPYGDGRASERILETVRRALDA